MILAEKEGVFDSSDDDDDESQDSESVVSQESFCMTEKKNVSNEDNKSGEILLSIMRKGKRFNYTCLLDTGTPQSLLDEKLVDKKLW